MSAQKEMNGTVQAVLTIVIRSEVFVNMFYCVIYLIHYTEHVYMYIYIMYPSMFDQLNCSFCVHILFSLFVCMSKKKEEVGNYVMQSNNTDIG